MMLMPCHRICTFTQRQIFFLLNAVRWVFQTLERTTPKLPYWQGRFDRHTFGSRPRSFGKVDAVIQEK